MLTDLLWLAGIILFGASLIVLALSFCALLIWFMIWLGTRRGSSDHKDYGYNAIQAFGISFACIFIGGGMIIVFGGH